MDSFMDSLHLYIANIASLNYERQHREIEHQLLGFSMVRKALWACDSLYCYERDISTIALQTVKHTASVCSFTVVCGSSEDND